jgi:hypothetical protein
LPNGQTREELLRRQERGDQPDPSKVLRVGEDDETFDYEAIGILIALVLWAGVLLCCCICDVRRKM